MCWHKPFFFSVFSVHVIAQKNITIRASAFPQAIERGGSVVMQCAYTVDPRHTVTIQWYATNRDTILIWPEDNRPYNAAKASFKNKVFRKSAYPLSEGLAIRVNNFQSGQYGYHYYCTISIRTSSDETYHASSNLLQISESGKDLLLQCLKYII